MDDFGYPDDGKVLLIHAGWPETRHAAFDRTTIALCGRDLTGGVGKAVYGRRDTADPSKIDCTPCRKKARRRLATLGTEEEEKDDHTKRVQ